MEYQHPNYEICKTYYLPADWVDEILPNLAAAPVDLVEQDADGSWWLRLPIGDPDREKPHYNTPLVVDEAISWNERRLYGTYSLTVHNDGTFTADICPADASLFALTHYWSDDIWDSIDELVKHGNPEMPSKPLDPGTHDFDAWHWSDDISMMFEVIDGKPSFRVVGHA